MNMQNIGLDMNKQGMNDDEQFHHLNEDNGSQLEHPAKRFREEINGTPEEILWKTAMRKDRAIANYYRRLSINNDIQFYQELLQIESIGEAMKRNIKNKLNILLTKKVEDRYEDLVL